MKTVFVYIRKPDRIMREVISEEALPEGPWKVGTERILHVKETKVHGQPRAVLCMLVPEQGEEQVISFGISKCNLAEDTFSKPFGRAEALKKAMTIHNILEKNPDKKRDSFRFNQKHGFGHIPAYGIETEKESERIFAEMRYQCHGWV